MKQARFISVDGVRTHYFEAGIANRGKRPSVLLLHSAEYGGAAEFSWEFNLDALGAKFHVVAPDHLGFGLTDKIFDFTGQFERRVTHIRRFLDVVMAGPVHVIGSSMSGGLALAVAARSDADWPFASLTVCSGGGDAPDNDARKTLNSYDGTVEHMRRIVSTMFYDQKWADDIKYVERRHEMANLAGAWEAVSAPRFRAPFRTSNGGRERDNINYGNIKVPALVMSGRHDPLRAPDYTAKFVPLIPSAATHVFEKAAHLGNIECAAEFNERVISFLEQA